MQTANTAGEMLRDGRKTDTTKVGLFQELGEFKWTTKDEFR